MNIQRIAIGLTIVNLILLVFLVTQLHDAGAQAITPMLRARGLQIIDDGGNTRAEILVVAPETVNGKTYPNRVLFRMADQNKRPVVKLTASAEGSSLGMSDDSEGAIHLNANANTGNFVKVVSRNGREQVLKP